MGSDLYVAASGAIARQRDLDVVANNLANADTIGFKRDRTLFRAALESAVSDAYRETTPGAPGRALVAVRGSAPDFSPGPIDRTGAPLDVAIPGPGFFAVETSEGVRYTRAGSFRIGPDGTLATPAGHHVLGESGTLQVGVRPVEIRASGDVVDDAGAVLGRLALVDFRRPDRLAKAGDNLYRALPGAEPEDLTAPKLVEGSVEGANVVSVRELARLIGLQRAFDAAMQSIQTNDRASERLIREVGS